MSDTFCYLLSYFCLLTYFRTAKILINKINNYNLCYKNFCLCYILVRNCYKYAKMLQILYVSVSNAVTSDLCFS